MRKYLLVTKVALVLVLLISRAAIAQIVNSSFENRNRAPVQRSNIGPLQSGYPYSTPDLTDWYHPGQVAGGNSTGINDSPDYIASDGTTYVNPVTFYPTIYGPQYRGFSAHTGSSCVQIGQSEASGIHGQDEFVTQELTQRLTPGHIYHAAFWALREPGTSVHTKLALSITDGDPIFDFNNNTLLPYPGRKVVVSGDIQQRYVWTKVEGDIIIPGNEPNNKWLTIGFDRSDQVYDPQAQNDYPIGGLAYAIDDVSLVDMGCAPIATPVTQSSSDNCTNVARFTITNFDSNLTYTFTRGFNNPVILKTTPFDGSFIVKTTGAVDGTFFITASNSSCGTATTSDEIAVTYPCDPAQPSYRTANATTAYPNPASESLTIPAGAKGATLINDKGKTLQKSNGSGQLDVQSLPDGLYNLQMMQDGKLINQRIQVKH